jgi:hypothetical protein
MTLLRSAAISREIRKRFDDRKLSHERILLWVEMTSEAYQLLSENEMTLLSKLCS